MTDQTKKEQPSSSGVDVFNMTSPKPKAEATPEAHDTAVKMSNVESARNRGVLQGRHFIALTLVVGAIWVAWPFVFGHSHAASPEGSSPRMLKPNQERSTNVIHPPVPTKALGESILPPPVKSDRQNKLAGNEPDAAARAIDESTAKINELQNKLAAAETKSSTCAAPNGLAGGQRQSNLHDGHRSPILRTHTNSQRDVSSPVLRGFTLNTIYRGQAWIQSDERTYVVQPGDVIGDVRIDRIEPNTRRVITSLGVIR